MSIFHFLPWNQFKVIPLQCTLRTRNLPKFSATSNVRYCVSQVRRCAVWLTNMEEKTGLNWKL